MRMKTQRILAALLSLVLLLALAPAGWAVDLDTKNTVNINLVPTDKAKAEDQTFANEIKNAKVKAELYRIAPAVADPMYDTYSYNFNVAAFAGLEDSITKALKTDPAEKTTYEMMLKSFSRIAQAAAEIVKSGNMDPDYSQAAATDTSTIELGGIQAGLYLVILRGNDFTNKIDTEEGEEGYFTTTVKEGGGQSGEYSNPDEPTDPDAKKPDVTITVTRARSNNYEFLFEPQIISLPTKMEGNDPTYNTAYGAWSTTLSLTAKPEMNPRFGKLKIIKTLDDYIDLSEQEIKEPALFVFEITAVKPAAKEGEEGKVVFKDVRGIEFTATGKESIVVERIPAGSIVTVKEVSSGAHYTAATPLTVSGIEITAEQDLEKIAAAEFENYFNGRNGGHGIINEMKHDGANWSSEQEGANWHE